MAFLSPSTVPPRELILDTYGKLWTELGHVDRNSDVMDRVAAGKDPFLLPKDLGMERDSLGALERHLANFKKMLEAHGWNDPDVQRVLLEFLQERGQGMRQQAERLQPVLEREGIVPKSYQLNHVKSFLAPDDQFFVSVDDLYSKEMKITLHDRKTGQETDLIQLPIPNHSLKAMGFTPDGKYLILADDRGPAMRLIPYEKGKLNLKAPVEVSAAPFRYRLAPSLDKRDSKPAETISFGKDGLIAMHCPYGGTTLFVFDTNAKKGWQLETPFLKNGDSLRNWGFIPGTRRIYFTIIEKANNPQTMRIDFAELMGKQLGPVSSVKSLETDNYSIWYSRVSVSADGKYGIITNKNGLELIDIEKQTTSLVPGKSAYAFFPDPKGTGFGVIAGAGDMNRTLTWFDPEKNTWTEDQQLPMRLNDKYMLSHDGREIITNVGNAAYRSTPFRR